MAASPDGLDDSRGDGLPLRSARRLRTEHVFQPHRIRRFSPEFARKARPEFDNKGPADGRLFPYMVESL